jgi:hypothetical protein
MQFMRVKSVGTTQNIKSQKEEQRKRDKVRDEGQNARDETVARLGSYLRAGF